MRRPLALVALTIALARCAGLDPAVSLTTAPSEPYLLVEREPDGSHWRATWHLAHPATGLLFERPSSFRSSLFEVVTPGFRFEKDGSNEVLRTEGPPVEMISVRFPIDDRPLEKDYAFFQKFSDGSAVLYTGHLVARPLQGNEDQCSDCAIRTFRFESDTPIIAGGETSPSPVIWRDRERDGNWIYFGSITPIESDHLIAIFDPALPSWLADEARAALPRLFQLYAERFETELPVKPTVLIGAADLVSHGRSFNGGVLPGQIQLTLRGDEWRERSDAAASQFFQFLAHEAVHLWNVQIIRNTDEEHSWLHEGSADAIAQRTLLELGISDEEQFLALQTKALNDCRRGLDGSPLRSAAARRQFDLYYSCGNMIALITEQSLPDRNLVSFWRTLIGETNERGEYGPDDYVRVWRDSGGREHSAEWLERFVESGATADALADALRTHGVTLETTASPPSSYSQPLARRALFHVMGRACKGRYGFSSGPNGLVLSDGLDCPPLPPSGVVTVIAGHHVLAEGHLVWDSVRDRCIIGTEVEIEIEQGGTTRTVPLRCDAPLPVRPDYLRITGR